MAASYTPKLEITTTPLDVVDLRGDVNVHAESAAAPAETSTQPSTPSVKLEPLFDNAVLPPFAVPLRPMRQNAHNELSGECPILPSIAEAPTSPDILVMCQALGVAFATGAAIGALLLHAFSSRTVIEDL